MTAAEQQTWDDFSLVETVAEPQTLELGPEGKRRRRATVRRKQFPKGYGVPKTLRERKEARKLVRFAFRRAVETAPKPGKTPNETTTVGDVLSEHPLSCLRQVTKRWEASRLRRTLNDPCCSQHAPEYLLDTFAQVERVLADAEEKQVHVFRVEADEEPRDVAPRYADLSHLFYFWEVGGGRTAFAPGRGGISGRPLEEKIAASVLGMPSGTPTPHEGPGDPDTVVTAPCTRTDVVAAAAAVGTKVVFPFDGSAEFDFTETLDDAQWPEFRRRLVDPSRFRNTVLAV